jgi:hypothetical protein
MNAFSRLWKEILGAWINTNIQVSTTLKKVNDLCSLPLLCFDECLLGFLG